MDTTQSNSIRRARRNRDGSRGRYLCPFNCRLADVCEVHYLTARMKDFAFWFINTLVCVFLSVSFLETFGIDVPDTLHIWIFCALVDIFFMRRDVVEETVDDSMMKPEYGAARLAAGIPNEESNVPQQFPGPLRLRRS